jgi:general stress protein YciG
MVVELKESKKHLRGFASLSTEKKREIASMGGKTAHTLGRAHRWTKQEASIAGRKGGKISRKRGPNARRSIE